MCEGAQSHITEGSAPEVRALQSNPGSAAPELGSWHSDPALPPTLASAWPLETHRTRTGCDSPW